MGCSLVFVCISMQKASGGSAQKDVCEHTLVWQKPPEKMQDPGKKCLPFLHFEGSRVTSCFSFVFLFCTHKAYFNCGNPGPGAAVYVFLAERGMARQSGYSGLVSHCIISLPTHSPH